MGIQMQPCCCVTVCGFCREVFEPPPPEIQVRFEEPPPPLFSGDCAIFDAPFVLSLAPEGDQTSPDDSCVYSGCFTVSGANLVLVAVATTSGGGYSLGFNLYWGGDCDIATAVEFYLDDTGASGPSRDDFCNGAGGEYGPVYAQLTDNGFPGVPINCEVSDTCCTDDYDVHIYFRVGAAEAEGIPHLLVGGVPNVATFTPPPIF